MAGVSGVPSTRMPLAVVSTGLALLASSLILAGCASPTTTTTSSTTTTTTATTTTTKSNKILVITEAQDESCETIYKVPNFTIPFGVCGRYAPLKGPAIVESYEPCQDFPGCMMLKFKAYSDNGCQSPYLSGGYSVPRCDSTWFDFKHMYGPVARWEVREVADTSPAPVVPAEPLSAPVAVHVGPPVPAAAQPPDASRLQYAWSITWRDCRAPHGNITGLEHQVLFSGHEATIVGKALVNEDVAGGTYNLEVRQDPGGPLVGLDNVDICRPDSVNFDDGDSLLGWTGLPCPLKAGALEFGLVLNFTSRMACQWSVCATTTVSLSAWSATNGDQFLCLEMTLLPGVMPGQLLV